MEHSVAQNLQSRRLRVSQGRRERRKRDRIGGMDFVAKRYVTEVYLQRFSEHKERSSLIQLVSMS